MPYLCAVFDAATQAVITEAADRFAASSPFKKDQTCAFHVPLIGGLHVYTSEEISAAVHEGSQVVNAPIEGHFVRWEASVRGRLRVVVSLAKHDGLARVSSSLPHGKEWRNELYVDVGSLSEIARSEWGAFVEAASAAFPITESSTFVCSTLDYIDAGPSRETSAPPPRGLNPNAPEFHPVAAASTHQRAKKRSARSTHRKWVRPGAMKKAAPTEMDWWAETGRTDSGRQPTIHKAKKLPNRRANSTGPLAWH